MTLQLLLIKHSNYNSLYSYYYVKASLFKVSDRVSTGNYGSKCCLHVVHASNRRERETQVTASQENTAYNANEKNLTQTDKDNEYSTIENTGYTTGDTKPTKTGNKNNTKRIRQKLDKNEYSKKQFAILIILVIVAFVLSLLLAVVALVYTNIELKNQMISTNKQVQSMNEQLNNQSSQQIQTLQAQLSDAILLL